jgi:hypothetical protein
MFRSHGTHHAPKAFLDDLFIASLAEQVLSDLEQRVFSAGLPPSVGWLQI